MKIDVLSLADYNQQRQHEARKTICWAPQKSMFFGLRGKVTSCCYNKTFLLGTFPEQTLQEIWFGEERKKQEEALKNNDLSLGCHSCSRIIKAGNFLGLPAKNFDHLPLSENGYPTKLDFELSNECNLECIMCRGEFSSAIRKNREGLPPIQQPYGESFLEELEEFIPHATTFHFLGGEPFLIPIYHDIWELISELNPKAILSVQTNATIVSTRIKQLLNKGKFNLAVSIDSVHQKNYEVIRKNGNFKKVMDNISYLRQYCRSNGSDFTLSFCPMPQNWTELTDIVEFASRLECKLYFNKVDFPRECSFQSLSKEELTNIISSVPLHSLTTGTAIEKANKLALEQVLEQIKFLLEQDIRVPDVSDYGMYLSELYEYLVGKNPAEGKAIYKDVSEKLFYIIDNHGADQKEIEEKIRQIDYASIYEGLGGVSKEHALHLFNAYILPKIDD